MKKLWLVLAVLGTFLPFYYLVPFFTEPGASVVLFVDLLLANSVSRFFAVDLIISSMAFLLWSFFDSKKSNVKGWWVVLIANLCVGLSLALPLYFFKRHGSSR